MKTTPASRSAFRHLLVPTDGSDEARAGVKAAIALARDLGARLRAVYLPPKREPLNAGMGALTGAPLLLEHFDDVASAEARKVLAEIKSAAAAAGVACVGEALEDPEPWPALLRVAEARRCDLIVIAPHGRLDGSVPRGAKTAFLILP